MQNIEKIILSTLFFDSDSVDEIINSLDVNDFFTNEYKIIYQTALFLKANREILDIWLINNLTNKKYEDILLDIQSFTPVVNIKAYILELKEYNTKINLQKKLKILSSDNQLSSMQIMQSLEEINKTSSYSFRDAISIVFQDDIVSTLPSFYLKEFLPIQHKEITLITAKGGSGKSYLGLYLLMKLQQEEKLRVFGYFSEDSVGITKHRMEVLQELHNMDTNIAFSGKESRAKPFIEYDKNKNLQPSEFFYKFKKQLKQFDVILIDPLIAFIADDENSNTEARYLMNLLNEWIEKEDKTIILIHHHSKGENGSARGAGAFVDAVRLHYSVNKIKANENETQNNTQRLVKLEKTNHYSGKSEFVITLFDTTDTIKNQNDEEANKDDDYQYPYDMSVFAGIKDSWYDDDEDIERKEVFKNNKEVVDEW